MRPARCAVCDGPRARLWARLESYKLLRCASCGVVFTDPMPEAEELRRLYANEEYFRGGGAAGYFAGYDTSAQSQSILYETILDQIGRPGTGAALLEIGCAEGQFLEAARKRGWDVCGVELSPAAASAARLRLNVPVLEGDLDAQLLEPNSYKVVVLLDVIEHLAEPTRTVRAAERVLRSGGLLVIKTPDIGSAQARRLGVRWSQIKPPEHLVYFDVASMTRMLRTCGFELDRLRSVGGTGIIAAVRRCARNHPALDRSNAIRAMVALKRLPGLDRVLARASAVLGRQDSMVVIAHKVARRAETDKATDSGW